MTTKGCFAGASVFFLSCFVFGCNEETSSPGAAQCNPACQQGFTCVYTGATGQTTCQAGSDPGDGADSGPNGGADSGPNGGDDGGPHDGTDVGVNPSQELSCMGVFDCFDGCPDDDACFDQCFDDGSAQAQSQINAIYTCWDASGCEQWDCVEQQCSSQVGACVNGTSGSGGGGGGGGGGGAMSCSQMWDCFGQCGQSDEACFDGCFSGGTAQGQQSMSALFDCMDRSGCEDETCLQSQCSSQIGACFG